MMGIELLNNSGIKYIGSESALQATEKTLIVVGVARGGTSLVAGTLSNLGVFSGTLSNAPVFEDVRLSSAFESGNLKLAEQVISEYDRSNKVWVFKRPSIINYLEEVHTRVRNPVYLFIFKDIFSIANRNSISMKLDILNGIEKAHNDYSKILSFIKRHEINGFLLSYEKIMNNKEQYVDNMVSLVGLDSVSNDIRSKALNFIEPNPQGYLNASRITRSIGNIGRIEETRVIGWGKLLHTETPVEVELFINDKLIKTQTANQLRKHLIAEKVHSTGKCGYCFDLSERPLRKGDKVAVKVKDDVLFLENSNQLWL
ncbi:hypothetical protein [Psychrobacter immobilis]|uniref:hypothetical protein n=1 Tax=Psychrobacter immobilis TaxID=498 RepID=UPI001919CA7B|nr:hypothetical protein [Psychrobacter immobilis]|tara:strand:- start:6188 stop:7129 length:942 start_codon:yes stop_codon:yes gene_type:complete